MITVVLGKPQEDGEELRKRVDKGCKVFKEENCEYLVLSGGKVNPEASNPEATLMEEYVEDIPSEKVILEDRSKGTIGNAYFTRKILESHNIDTGQIFVVTSCYHSGRGKYIFDQVFENSEVNTFHCVEFDNPQAEKEEKESLIMAENFFKNISPGNMEGIRYKLEEKFDHVELG